MSLFLCFSFCLCVCRLSVLLCLTFFSFPMSLFLCFSLCLFVCLYENNNLTLFLSLCFSLGLTLSPFPSSVCIFLSDSVFLSLSRHLSPPHVSLSLCLSLFLSVCLSVSVCLCLSVSLCLCLSLSVCLSLCLLLSVITVSCAEPFS